MLAGAGAGLDTQGRALLEEDLRSPCTEEIAVFRAFARAVDQGQEGFVVLDTAPTGHTILLVTLPEATPVHEAAQLQDDLVRAGIRPFAWVVNQSLAPLPVTDPVLLARQHHEGAYIREVVQQRASRTAIVPWLTQPPVGPESLLAVIGGIR